MVPLAFGRVIPEKTDIGIQVPGEVETQSLKQEPELGPIGQQGSGKQQGTVIQTQEGAGWR